MRAATELPVMLVEIRDSDGRSGWGEAPVSWRVTGESPESIRAVIDGPLVGVALGREVADLPALADELRVAVAGNASARSAVDGALHDLASQSVGVTLVEFLGGGVSEISTDMTLSVAPADELTASALQWTESGFGTIKVKVGPAPATVDALRRVRDAVGPAIRIRVDANQAWSPREAVDIITEWERIGLDIEFVEQPVGTTSLDDLAFVTERVATPVMADESVWTSRDLRELVRRGAADMVNLKLAKSGGIGETRLMLRLASEAGIQVLIGTMMQSSVGVATAASVAASAGLSDTVHDLDAGLWLSESPVRGGSVYQSDVVRLSPRPGLGIEGLR
ncbi:MAG: dipeptide epimerase [Actinomycetota bacterium]|nr:dipeptide epimerase [Actinomycetota bacterium]